MSGRPPGPPGPCPHRPRWAHRQCSSDVRGYTWGRGLPLNTHAKRYEACAHDVIYCVGEYQPPPAGAQNVASMQNWVQNFRVYSSAFLTCGPERRMQQAGAPGGQPLHGAQPTRRRGAQPATPPPPRASVPPAHSINTTRVMSVGYAVDRICL